MRIDKGNQLKRIQQQLYSFKFNYYLTIQIQINLLKMFLTIVTILFVYWVLLSLVAYYNVKKIFSYYHHIPPIQIKQSWKGFASADFCKWDQKGIIKGCFLRFPFNLTLLGLYLVGFSLLVQLNSLLGNRFKKQVIWISRKYGNFAIRQAMNIVEQQDFLNYQIQTPIIISNHINWFDPWYIGTTFLPMSIVSKAIIKKSLFIGAIGDFFDTIYVQRKSQSQRDDVVVKISERVHKFNEAKKNPKTMQKVNPLIMFPEGTTSNGKSILTFKMGAFNDLSPLTMFGLKYTCKQFSMGMGDVPQSHHAFFMLCLKPTLHVTHKQVHPKSGETPQEYCKRCREQLSQLTGNPQVQSGYRDNLQYDQAILDAYKANTQGKKPLQVSKKTKTKNN